MRRTWKLFIVACVAGYSVGCGNPMAPLKDGDQYICKTKVRTYYLTDGTLQHVIDYYAQSTPCPAIPID